MADMSTVYVKSYAEPRVDEKEILRYAGVREAPQETEALLHDCLREILPKLTYKVCYREFDVIRRDGGLDLGFAFTDSRGLAKNLLGCQRIVLFAATVGLELDRAIARYGVVSPAKSLMLQAIGAERVESLCDSFESELRQRFGNVLRPRFSAGYGDLALELQRDIFAVLDCQRKIGLTLNDSCLMSPSKSVTAVIGIGGEREKREDGCNICSKIDCIFRREK